MELERPVQLSDTIKIACIGTTPPIKGHRLIASGWGVDTGHKHTPRFLQGTEMIVVPLEECKNAFARNITFNNIFDEVSDKFICVKDEQLDSTVCYGDSGG